MSKEFKYDVFLSYRHKPLDSEITRRTFNKLESFKVPSSLAKEGFEPVKRVFRDTEELAVNRILSATIDDALRSTKCFVIVCSEDTPSSEWVDREVETYIELGRAEYIYPLLISGDKDKSFPPSLKLIPDIDERIMDVRANKSINDIMEKEDEALLKVIARVMDIKEEKLAREYKIEKTKKLTTRVVTACLVLGLAVGVSGLLMNIAMNYQKQAIKAQETSMSLLSKLTYELPDRLSAYPNSFSKIRTVLEENTKEMNDILSLAKDKNTVNREIASNYEKLATSDLKLAYLDDAKNYEEKAIGLYQEVAADKNVLASAYNNLATIYSAEGDFVTASKYYDDSIGMYDRNHEELPAVLSNAGANCINLGDYDEAADYLEQSIDLFKDKNSHDYALAIYNYGLSKYRTAEYEDAREAMDTSITLYREFFKENKSQNNLINLISSYNIYLSILNDMGKIDEALQIYEENEDLAIVLSGDRENVEALRTSASFFNNYGLTLNTAARYNEAEQKYLKASEVFGDIYKKSGSIYDGAQYALSYNNLGENAFQLNEMNKSEKWLSKGLSIMETDYDNYSDYWKANTLAWKSWYEIIHSHDFKSALANAEKANELQDSLTFVKYYLGYSLMYNNMYDEADKVFGELGSLGEGVRETVRLEFASLRKAGLLSDYMKKVEEEIFK